MRTMIGRARSVRRRGKRRRRAARRRHREPAATRTTIGRARSVQRRGDGRRRGGRRRHGQPASRRKAAMQRTGRAEEITMKTLTSGDDVIATNGKGGDEMR
ncbi:hypothetical protein PIB30_056800 [Stylosanthes scabra]|uniref:Uncharacterized protein n=1 Tax=Stylosanthes scabra TaxID=79078 RepID=A0ABU6RJE3_9FABA|nr:hypothetical protein [Stylosanthes scabra]